jgi:hypothetical protein
LTVAALAAAVAFGETSATAAGGGLGAYRMLVLNGQKAKWGAPALGTGASLTYALANAPLRTEGAINCADIAPVDRLLAANRLARGEFEREVEAAFGAWSAVADITFTRVADPAKADIVIGAGSFGRGRAFTNVATVRALQSAAQAAYAVAQPGTITRSLICLNPGQPWKIGFDGNLNVYDIRYALMHEIGHAIGLDHPDAPNAVMDFQYTEAFSTLQPGDVAGAAALYGTRMMVARAASPPAAAPLDVDH